MKRLIKKGYRSLYNAMNDALSIEYEQLERELKDNVLKKYHKYDEAEKNEEVYNDKTTLLMPGTADTNFDEPNTKPPYPQSNIPYSQGEIWSD